MQSRPPESTPHTPPHTDIQQCIISYQELDPSLPKVLALNSNELIIGGIRTAATFLTNVYTTSAASSSDLAAHPGFSVQPIAWCNNPNNQAPLPNAFFSVNTSAALAGAVQTLTTSVAANPESFLAAQYVLPATIVLEQNMSVTDVLLLASSSGGSINLSLSLLITGPSFPIELGVPPPPSVSLDLSGCAGCLTLTGQFANLYVANLNLVGAQLQGSGTLGGLLSHGGCSPDVNNDGDEDDLRNSSRIGGGFVRFNCSDSVRVHLRNVSLTVPQAAFQQMLVALPSSSWQVSRRAGGLRGWWGRRGGPAGLVGDLEVCSFIVILCV